MPRGGYLTKWIDLEQGHAKGELKTLVFPTRIVGQVIDVTESDKVASVDPENSGLELDAPQHRKITLFECILRILSKGITSIEQDPELRAGLQRNKTTSELIVQQYRYRQIVELDRGESAQRIIQYIVVTGIERRFILIDEHLGLQGQLLGKLDLCKSPQLVAIRKFVLKGLSFYFGYIGARLDTQMELGICSTSEYT